MHDIITIGTATRDIFLTSPFFKTIKDSKHFKSAGFPTGEAQCFALGGKIEIGKPFFSTGGGATNAAVLFSRQGFKTASLVKIGNDEAAKIILNELKKEKINILNLQSKIYNQSTKQVLCSAEHSNKFECSGLQSNNGTAYSTILLSPSGERTILVYRGASESLAINEIPFEKLKSRWAYIVPGKISFSAMEEIFNYLHKNKILIAFNPSKYFIEMGLKKMKPFLNKSKVVILNREEASYLTKIDYRKEKEIFKFLDEVVGGIAAMTDGGNGVLVSDGRNIYKAGVFKEKKVIDRTGAGDAFGSGFVAGLLQKREECGKGRCGIDNIEYAIRLGSANATSVIEKIGAKAGILTKKEFEKSERWKKIKIENYGII